MNTPEPAAPASPAASLPVGARLHGFTLLRRQPVPEVGCVAQLWTHDATGARLLSMLTDDDNKVFGISFRTPPTDSTGIAHILEHSVLCGSRKYPVKEPFVELLKGSLQTFLNAFTYPDKTCYPVASANLQDFYNLIDVYLDAVFHPRLSEQVLAQEGWHYEPAEAAAGGQGGLVYKGVVFGEMKGAYSSPDAVLSEASQQAVFPNCTYGLDSGGDPERIPDLTFEAFAAFHADYYHPSNSYIYFYGDDDPAKRLEIMAAALEGYAARRVDSEVRLQPRLEAPSRIERHYAASGAAADEDCDAKAMCTVNWLLARTDRPETSIALEMLEHVLIGLPSSPLRKALMDSGLGEDVAGVGLEDELRQSYFSVGLKGMEAESLDTVEALVLSTLERLAGDGVDRDMADAAVNSIEFDLREQNTGRFPRGLSIMLQALTTWLHELDPLAPVAFDAPLAAIKARLAQGEPLFENLIRTLLLDNPHRVTVLLTPDPQLAARREAAERERLDKAARQLGPEGLTEVAEMAQALREAQERPDPPEALARIPRLGLKDLPPRNKPIPKEETSVGGVRMLAHDLPTRGIAYLDVGLDLCVLTQEYLPAVPLFGRALLEMGTDKDSFVALTRRIAARTGGIDAVPFIGAREGSGEPAPWLFLRGKATADMVPELVAILRDVLLTARFDDRERFRQMVLEEKARLEERLIPSGHSLVASRLKAGLCSSGFLSELLFGVENLFFLRRLADLLDMDWARVLNTLEEMRRLLIRKGGLLLNVTADDRAAAALGRELPGLLEFFPSGPAAPCAHRARPLPQPEGLTAPSQVNYVGKGVSLESCGYAVRGADLTVARYLRTAYLWDRVRVQGGAYGAFCSLDRISGTLLLLSYRDPNLGSTLAAYDAMRDYLKSLEIGGDELVKSIVGAIGDLDAYQLPDAKGFTSLARDIQGVTDDKLQELREEVLSTSREDFRRFARAAGCLAEHGRTVVLGSREALVAAGGLHLTKVL